MTSTETAPALTADTVRSFAAAWYRALDRHDDVETILPLMVDDGLKLVFPEATKHGHAGFRDWYAAVTNRFFDEVHTLREATITSSTGDSAQVSVVVNWQAKIWNAPGPRSEWLGFDAYQTWTVVRGPDGPQVGTYVVDELRPMPGSASL
jgi:ketosteroid isomerase-like protein